MKFENDSDLEKVKCEKCKDTGWVFTEGGVTKCSCQLINISDQLYERMRIPTRYREKSLSNYIPKREGTQKFALLRAISYVSSDEYKEGKGMFIYGPPGVGKTHLAVGILKDMYLKKGIVGLFRDTRTLLFDLKGTFEGYGSSRELLDEVLQAPILVLDDLGNERLSDWAKDILHYIIINRYNDMKPVIITSNTPLKKMKEDDIDIADKLGGAIASRLVEMAEILEVQGEDERAKKSILNKLHQKEEEDENS